MGAKPHPAPGQAVPVEELVDLERLALSAGRPPTPREIREALPPGWTLDEDGRSARRDLRLLFSRGWMLALLLLCFGAAAAGLFWWSAPFGGSGWVRFAVALALLALVGGIVGPLVTRALSRRH